MKRVIIVVEGQTEQAFVEQSLSPFLYNKYGILSVSARLLGKPGHKGGDVRYSRLKSDLDILSREPNVVISTFIDFFRLANDFPNTILCQQHTGSEDQITCLEQGLSNAINVPAFIPYIQRHEFEALLFASDKGFLNYFKASTCAKLTEICQRYPNPEDINNTEPPAYRLSQIIEKYEERKYEKVSDGNILALEVGIEIMLATCPRFARWIGKLTQAATI